MKENCAKCAPLKLPIFQLTSWTRPVEPETGLIGSPTRSPQNEPPPADSRLVTVHTVEARPLPRWNGDLVPPGHVPQPHDCEPRGVGGWKLIEFLKICHGEPPLLICFLFAPSETFPYPNTVFDLYSTLIYVTYLTCLSHLLLTLYYECENCHLQRFATLLYTTQ